MASIYLRSVGLIAPGIPDWPTGRAVLRRETAYSPAPVPPLPPALLPPNERRRATPPTRLALEAARQACEGAGIDPRELPSIFASSDGDMDLIDRLCKGITQPEVALSPTLFHNSVHNAVAGYWSIGTQCRAQSTSIAAADGTFAAGLLECATQLACDCEDILLVAYDLPAPELLDVHRHFEAPFACAFVLGTDPKSPRLAELRVSLGDPAAPSSEAGVPAEILPLCLGNPAARSLLVLNSIASGKSGHLHLPYLEDLSVSAQILL